METSNADIIRKLSEIVAQTDLPYLKAGIHRLLYPEEYINKGIVHVDIDNINISDPFVRNEMINGFCETIFFSKAVLFVLNSLMGNNVFEIIKKRDYHVKNKRFATFREVHRFLTTLGRKTREQILHNFEFSNKTIIELLELFDEDDNYSEHPILYMDEKGDDDDYRKYYKKHFSKDSHCRFEDIIKREDYPPLFFAVLVFMVITKQYNLWLDYIDFAFCPSEKYKMDTFTIKYPPQKRHKYSRLDHVSKFINHNLPFSNYKFTDWVDEWLENFDSFINTDDFFKKWIDIASNNSEKFEMFEEHHYDYNEPNFPDSYSCSYNSDDPSDFIYDIKAFLGTRGWNILGYTSFDYEVDDIINSDDVIETMGKYDFFYSQCEWHVGYELKRIALRYSIIQEVIPEMNKTTINWWLRQTHYDKIFYKLVEYYTATYLDNGQRQIPSQEAESSAIETSNEVEQLNIPVIDIDKDEAHKEWFVRVHEKKINAQPDEWNKKLYSCLDALYESLVKRGLMYESSKKELFIYRLSGFNIPKSFNPLEKIRWEGSNVLLGYLVRCLITYTGTDAKGLGTVGTFFESKKGNDVNLATADYISKEEFNQNPKMYPVLSRAVEILKECGFEEVEATSTRKRDK